MLFGNFTEPGHRRCPGKFIAFLLLDIETQWLNGGGANHAHHRGQFMQGPVILGQFFEEFDQGHDRTLTAQLPQRTPGVERHPDLQAIARCPVQGLVTDQFN